jgi:hypothetical protein
MLRIKWLAGAVVVGVCMAVSLFFWPFEPVLLRFGLNGHLERLTIGAVIALTGIVTTLTTLSATDRRRRRQKYEEKTRKRRQSKLKRKESAAWVGGHDDLSRVLDKMVELQKMPRPLQKLRFYWGYPEFLDLVDDLLTMEQGRESRQGFDPKVHQEVSGLRQFYIENIEKVMSTSLTEVEKDRIRHRIRKYL